MQALGKEIGSVENRHGYKWYSELENKVQQYSRGRSKKNLKKLKGKSTKQETMYEKETVRKNTVSLGKSQERKK